MAADQGNSRVERQVVPVAASVERDLVHLESAAGACLAHWATAHITA
jgi:hypothetical protein